MWLVAGMSQVGAVNKPGLGFCQVAAFNFNGHFRMPALLPNPSRLSTPSSASYSHVAMDSNEMVMRHYSRHLRMVWTGFHPLP